MKRMIRYRLLAVVGLALAGCASNASRAELIKDRSESNRKDVFIEVNEKGVVPKAYADLVIEASIKTHAEGYYLFEPRDSLHGKPDYPFLLNIDGQAVIWKIDGREETAPRYTPSGEKNPEGGTGIKYLLRKKVRLAPGSHRVSSGLPGESYISEFAITLKEERTYVLAFEPVYRWQGKKRSLLFTGGLKRYERSFTEIHPE